MGCEICGRNNCCKSFHSLEEQKSFDDVADIVKDKCRSIIRRKLANDAKTSYINTELENMMSLIMNNWDTFGGINTEGIAELLDIPLQRGVSNTRITKDICNILEEIHDRNSFCSCLR